MALTPETVTDLYPAAAATVDDETLNVYVANAEDFINWCILAPYTPGDDTAVDAAVEMAAAHQAGFWCEVGDGGDLTDTPAGVKVNVGGVEMFTAKMLCPRSRRILTQYNLLRPAGGW